MSNSINKENYILFLYEKGIEERKAELIKELSRQSEDVNCNRANIFAEIGLISKIESMIFDQQQELENLTRKNDLDFTDSSLENGSGNCLAQMQLAKITASIWEM